MHRFTLFLATAAAFVAAPFASRLGPVLGALVFVSIGVGLAWTASAGVNAVAAASGALGAFALGTWYASLPVVAGAALLAFCYFERSLRIKETPARVIHVILASGAGAIAGYLAWRYAGSDLGVRATVVIVTAILAGLPLFVEADDVVAHTLDTLADDLPKSAAKPLRAGAELRRSVDAALLDRRTAREMNETWNNLVRLAQARSRLENRQPKSEKKRGKKHTQNHRAVIARVEERIADHVRILTQAYTAVDAAHAAEASMNDAAARSVETTGESLDEVSRALVDDVL